jgi:hypothetical protein
MLAYLEARSFKNVFKVKLLQIGSYSAVISVAAFS